MKRKTLVLMGLLFLSSSIVPASAEKIPLAGIADARIKTVAYSSNNVYRLEGHYGFTTIVEFSPKERIETIAIGDSDAWQVVKPRRQNIMFVKPLEPDADTDLTVITNKHIYTFQLDAQKATSPDDPSLTFRLRFTYPDQGSSGLMSFSDRHERHDSVTGPRLTARNLNFNYAYSGARALRPERVFDDGKFTYFQFQPGMETPAIFAVDGNGHQSIVNFATEGNYIVAERLARQFALRDGDNTTNVYDESYSRPSGQQDDVTQISTIRRRGHAHSWNNHQSSLPSFLSWTKSIHPSTSSKITYNQ